MRLRRVKGAVVLVLVLGRREGEALEAMVGVVLAVVSMEEREEDRRGEVMVDMIWEE